jgi:hypothetical protein
MGVHNFLPVKFAVSIGHGCRVGKVKGKSAAWKRKAAPAKAKHENIRLRFDRRACSPSDTTILIA